MADTTSDAAMPAQPPQPAGASGARARVAPDFPQVGVRRFGRFNTLGVWTLYKKEVQRFMKVAGQTVFGPLAMCVLFLAVFTLALSRFKAGVPMGDTEIALATFIAPGLIMMQVLQNAFANTSSSLLISKVQGNVVDILMPPLSPGELAFCFALGAATRGVMVAFVCAAGVWWFADLSIHNVFAVAFFCVGGALIMAQIGLVAGIWAEKFDNLATITNFVILPLTFLSGTFYSVKNFPDWLEEASHYNPFFYFIDGFRYGFIGEADGNVWIGVAVVLVLNVVLAYVSWDVFRRGWRLKA